MIKRLLIVISWIIGLPMLITLLAISIISIPFLYIIKNKPFYLLEVIDNLIIKLIDVK